MANARNRATPLLLALAVCLCAAAPAGATSAGESGGEEPSAQAPDAGAAHYLALAERGVTRAQQTWRDHRRGWYDERLGDRQRYPLATIWGSVPLFEALDAVDIAAPNAAHRAALAAFAAGAERYFDATLRPTPGFAPYPGDRGQVRTWFDDNGWWGLAFMDAYRATGSTRYLHDAQRAFAFIAAQGWDARAGGLWWNTSHPYKAGEALASGTLLGALLFERTHDAFYLAQVNRFLGWADVHFRTELQLYELTDSNSTPTPYVEGTLVEAEQVLCESGQASRCARARELADASWQRFRARLNMGPQFDTIYLHWMLLYGAQARDSRWAALATQMAAQAEANSVEARSGLYLRAWDGGSITEHEAQPGMLQTDAATLELFAWLGGAGGGS